MPWRIGRYTPGMQDDGEAFDFSLLQEGFRKLTQSEVTDEIPRDAMVMAIPDPSVDTVRSNLGVGVTDMSVISLVSLIISTVNAVACAGLAIICRKQAKKTERLLERIQALYDD